MIIQTESRSDHRTTLQSISTVASTMSKIDQSAGSLSKELLGFCKSDSLSEEGLRQIIERQLGGYKFFLQACRNERVTEGMIRCLLEYFPDAARTTDEFGWLPLHCLCENKSITLDIIQLVIDAAPESIRSVNKMGRTPLHILCSNRGVDEAAAIQVLTLLIETYPEGVRHVDDHGRLPIHFAAGAKSPEFCQILIGAYPGSEQVTFTNDDRPLPLHWACSGGSLATVEYFYRLFPDAINHASTGGLYPIHEAVSGTKYRNCSLTPAVEIVQFLLDCDPNQKLVQFQGGSLLQYACRLKYNYFGFKTPNIEAGIQVIEALFDAHPEAIEDNGIVIEDYGIAGRFFNRYFQEFIYRELVYARQAKNLRLMMTPDDNKQLPLHRALQNNVRLGSIKLLVKGNPSAVRTFDNESAIPLHVACEHHDSARVIQYLVELDTATLDAVDKMGNTVLHYACRGAKYDTIALLLEKYDALLASVSKRNNHGKLPIDLLLESKSVKGRECPQCLGHILKWLRSAN